MTKFILHGGMTSVENENNKKFFQEIVKDLPESPKILISLFSIEEGRWEEEYGYQKDNFIKNLGDLSFEFQLANKENFLDQVEWADAVHFRGGDTLKILEIVKKFPDFKKKISSKTISGSSARAYFLVEHSFGNERRMIYQGLGIIPINLLGHYESENYDPIDEKSFEELKNKNNKELILLRECEYKVIKIN